MEVKVCVHRETLLVSDNAYVRHIAGGNVCIALGVMRFAHLQRSEWVLEAEKVMVARCSLGKSKKNGSRGAFWWVLGKRGLVADAVSDGIAQEHKGILKLLNLSRSDFLFFDFGPKGHDISQASHFTSAPLPYAKFLAASRKLVCF